MAWTNPRTWVVGELVTAALMNQQIRDNELFLGGPPVALVRRAAAQSIPDATWTAISFDTQELDTDDMWVIGDPTKLTIKVAGDYQIGGSGCIVSLAGNRIGARGRLNGATVLRGRSMLEQVGGSSSTPNFTMIVPSLIVNDYLEMQMFQDDGAAKNTHTSIEAMPVFWARLVRVA